MSISDLIYGKDAAGKPTISTDLRVDPDDFPQLAGAARDLNVDIRTAYADALAEREAEERETDHYFLDRAKDYVELNEQVETSATLLTELASFLSTFQHDLSAVSGHISELQGRSKTIEQRLESRKAVERSLHPLLHSIVISPTLIHTIMDTEVGDLWIPAIIELDAKLGAIRSGPRIESRKQLDEVAEALRVAASSKILTHLLLHLRPFALSVTLSLPDLQSTILLPLKPLFDFLRRHSARQAHEFQKAYTSTVRWYYETGFRRYIRGLEKVRLRGFVKHDPIGVVAAGSDVSLALLSKGSPAASEAISNVIPAVLYSEIAGPEILTSYTTENKALRPPPEALFRSLSLVLMENAQTEYAFVSEFFGQHSEIPVLQSRSPALPSSGTSTPDLISRESSIAGDRLDRRGSDADSVYGSESGRTSLLGSTTKEERGEKLRKTMIDSVWRSIMEPAQEYTRNFSAALLEPPPTLTSLLSMIRLNESVITSLVSTSLCPPMENHLFGLRLLFWPSFTKVMAAQIESLRKINGSFPSGGVFGGKGTGLNVKDSVVLVVGVRFVELFTTAVELTGEQDEDMVFASLLRLRNELDKLLVYQGDKILEDDKKKAFLSTHYDALLQGISSQSERVAHPRTQEAMAHYRLLLQKCSV